MFLTTAYTFIMLGMVRSILCKVIVLKKTTNRLSSGDMSIDLDLQ